MVYTATTWVSGDVITAARLNNLEGQFDDAYGYIRYSTASTGTVLINLPGTYDSTGTVGQWITTIMVPVNVQKSRVEVSCSLYSYYSSYPLYLNVYRTDVFDPTTSFQAATPLLSLTGDATSYVYRSGNISITGGDRIAITRLNPGGFGLYVKDIKICATTTTPIDNFDGSFLPYTTDAYTGIGTSTGG